MKYEDKSILEIAHEYYSELYRSTEPTSDSLEQYFNTLNDLPHPQLIDTSKYPC